MARILRQVVFAALIAVIGFAAVRALPASVAKPNGVSGRITDLTTDLPIAGVRVSAGGLEAYTDEDGRFHLPVGPGTYDVRAEDAGYIGMTRRSLAVPIGQEASLDLAMIVAAPNDAQSAIIDDRMIQSVERASGDQVGAAIAAQAVTATAVTTVPASIRVLLADGSVVTMSLDEYLKGVVPHEMPPNWPAEALRAQAVAARSYAITASGHADVGADVCTTSHCQAWSPIFYDSTDQAVAATSGVTARYQGNVIRAFFHAHCDGHTRDSEVVWGGQVAYLRGVACPCGFTALYGHGVGMCQYGARSLALQGYDYATILKHYYTGVEVAGPQAISLRDPAIAPTSGDQGTLFRFGVTYQGGADVPPAVANVVIDGRSHALELAADPARPGREYQLDTYLPSGEHSYYYYVADGLGQEMRLPATGTYTGPAVAPGGAPMTPTVETVTGESLTFSTLGDWSDGSFDGIQVGAHGDGSLTLADARSSGVYTSPPMDAPLAFVALGGNWHAQLPDDATFALEIRTSTAGDAWGPWRAMVRDSEPGDGAGVHASLLFGEGLRLQYRVTLRANTSGARPVLENLSLVCIDSRAGPTASALRAAAIGTAADGMPPVISRAAWGANEALMTSPPEYQPVEVHIVHHTVTGEGGVDPAVVVRAVYYYHAVTLQWGDIGYNYLIDVYGNVYEGRYGGSGVVGHHAGKYNWGSLGVSLIGDFEAVDVPKDMRNSLTSVLAAKSAEWRIDPLGQHVFIDKMVPNILGHRDVGSTACPGARAYALLPQIRTETGDKLDHVPPQVRITTVSDGAALRGVVALTAESNVYADEMTLYVDGAAIDPRTGPTNTWQVNTFTLADGTHTLKVIAKVGTTISEAQITVRVDNTAPTGTAAVAPWNNSVLVPVTISSPDAVAVQFSNNWVWEGEDLDHQAGSGSRVADPQALNGIAWKGTAGPDAGWWFGPYTLDLPPWRAYQVIFRLKSPRTFGAEALALLDVVDNRSTRVYQQRTLAGQDVPTVGYYDYALDVAYQSTAATYEGQQNGVEFRTMYRSVADVYLDRVSVFSAPLSLPTGPWEVRPAEGPQSITARLLDQAGNALEIPLTVQLDLTPPQQIEMGIGTATVRDTVSGLNVRTAEWSSSTVRDFYFDKWTPIPLTEPMGTKEAVRLQAPAGTTGWIRLRIKDVAGNQLNVNTYTLLPTPTPVPPFKAPVLPLIEYGGTH